MFARDWSGLELYSLLEAKDAAALDRVLAQLRAWVDTVPDYVSQTERRRYYPLASTNDLAAVTRRDRDTCFAALRELFAARTGKERRAASDIGGSLRTRTGHGAWMATSMCDRMAYGSRTIQWSHPEEVAC